MKYDNGKNRLDLICPEAVEGLGKVLTFGASKYSDNSWQQLDNAEQRYKAAMYRHLLQYMKGEKNDEESGLSHLYHIMCNAMFIDYFDRTRTDDDFTEMTLEVYGGNTIEETKEMPSKIGKSSEVNSDYKSVRKIDEIYAQLSGSVSRLLDRSNVNVQA